MVLRKSNKTRYENTDCMVVICACVSVCMSAADSITETFFGRVVPLCKFSCPFTDGQNRTTTQKLVNEQLVLMVLAPRYVIAEEQFPVCLAADNGHSLSCLGVNLILTYTLIHKLQSDSTHTHTQHI